MKSLEQLSGEEADYQPSTEVKNLLKQVHLVCVVGGVGVGKNYLMKQSGLPVVGRVTSRPPRPDDDPKTYSYFTNKALTEMIARGELVQYAVDLPNKVMYGSVPSDYVQNGPTLADIWHWSVDMLQNKGFGSVSAISIISPWEQWQHQLEERFARRDEAYKNARLEEAVKSLEWTKSQILRKNPSHAVVINDQARTAASIQTLQTFAKGQGVPTPADALLLIDSLIKHLN